MDVIRLGIVTNVDDGRRLARVKFPDEDLPSDWLPVLASPPFIPARGAQQTGITGGGSGYAAFEKHDHPLTISPWMPDVNDQVLVAFSQTEDGDGFILGRIDRWR